MWQYLCMYFLSCSMTAFAEYNLRKNKIRIFYVLSFIALFLPALLAGARSSGVGTDVLTYGNYIFNRANSTNLLGLYSVYRAVIEPLYLLLNFMVSRITSDVHVFYFVLQLLTVLFIYLGLYENREKSPMWLGLLVYFTLFFPFSLNGMRQALAIAIVYYAFKYIFERDFKHFVFFILLATGFHYTAILCLSFYILNYFFNKFDSFYVTVASVLAFFVALFGCGYIIRIMSSIFGKYDQYLEINLKYVFSFKPFLLRVPIVTIFLLWKKLYKSKSETFSFWIVLLIGDMVFSQLRSTMAVFYRISLFFGAVKMNAYPFVNKVFSRKSKWIVNVVLVIYLLIVWYYQIVLQGNEGVFPYKSNIFSWLN